MTKSEIYQPVSSVQIESFTLEDIQGTKASVRQSPFKEGHIPVLSCVSVEPDDNDYSISQSYLNTISRYHGRSYEFKLGETNTIVWSDEYGNIYTKLNTKGNNCTISGAYPSESAPSGFILYGLQESNEMVRVLKASEVLRSHHVDTEAILKVIEPAELPFKGQKIPLPEFKRKLVQKAWEEDASQGARCEKTGWTKVSRSQLPQLSIALDKMTMFITIRGVQVSERLADLTQASNEEELLQIIGNAFLFVNIEEQIKAKRDKDYIPESFSIDRPEDIDKYFTEYFAKRVAHNFAKMHKLGLIHFYPHTGNISMVGSIYDLDSVRGKPLGLGDKPVTDQDIVNDVLSFINGNNAFPAPNQIIARLITDHPERFKTNFLRHYIQEMEWKGDIVRFSDIYTLFGGFKEENKAELLDYYLDEVTQSIDLRWNIDTTEVMAFMIKELPALEKVGEKMSKDEIRSLFISSVEEIMCWEIMYHYENTHPQATSEERGKVELYAQILASKQVQRIFNVIETSLQEDPQANAEIIAKNTTYKTLDTCKCFFYERFVEELGWEEDIVHHAEEIDDLFEGFISWSSNVPLDYYVSKLSEQFGWTLVINESLEDMIEMFHEFDQDMAKECIEKALANTSAGKDRASIIEEALKTNEFGEDFTSSHEERYMHFIIDDIIITFLELYEAQFIEKYGETEGRKNVRIIASWFGRPYEDKFRNDLPKEKNQEIENAAKVRIEQLKQQYLGK